MISQASVCPRVCVCVWGVCRCVRAGGMWHKGGYVRVVVWGVTAPPPQMATAAVGTRPTGMYSCLICFV